MFIKTQISILEGVYEWSNDAENSALHHNNTFNLLNLKIRKKQKQPEQKKLPIQKNI